MKQYLLDTFHFNDRANRQVLAKIKELPDSQVCVLFFSHLINSQIKWLARINQYPQDPKLDWWKPAYPLEELESRWAASLQDWVSFLENKTEAQLLEEVRFIGFDGSHMAARLKDIALQLNYHSIHHRAQMQMIIREQGLEPDFIDYIGTAYRKLSLEEI